MRDKTGEIRQPQAVAAHASRVAAWFISAPEARWARIVGFSAGTGAFLAFVGAFDSYTVPLTRRLPLFVGFAVCTGLVAFGASAWVGRQRWGARVLPRFAALVLFMTLATGLATWGGDLLSRGQSPRPPAWIFFGISFVMSLAMTSLSFAIFRPPRLTHAAPAGAPEAKFLARLPAKLRGADLWALEAEDHYLRLHTSRGEELILMRLSDAIGELEGIEGAQTHRSWWVARAAVSDVKRGDGRATLVLPNGKEAPASRTYARALREAGWF